MSYIAIQPVNIAGRSVIGIRVSDHRVISGKEAVAEIPEVVADPEAVPPVSGRLAIPGQAVVPGNVESYIDFIAGDGTAGLSTRLRLTPEQYAAWDDTVIDDDVYFTTCQASNLGVTVLE